MEGGHVQGRRLNWLTRREILVDGRLPVDRLGVKGLDPKRDLDPVAKVERVVEFGGGPYPWPAATSLLVNVNQGPSDFLEEGRFGGLDIAEKIGEVDQSGHVGLGKFHNALEGEGFCHEPKN